MNFESTLLRHLIEDKVFFNRAKTVLKKSIFSNIANGTIYDIMEKHYNKYKEVPTVSEIILEARELPNAELKRQIAQSLNEIPQAEKINEKFLGDYTLRYAKNQLFEQALIEGAEFIDKHSEKAKEKARALIEESQKLSMVADLGDLYSDFEPRFEYYQNPEKGFKYLRFHKLNEFLGEGILPGTLNLFLAPPGIGKSMMISYTIGDCLLQKKNVLLVSMEMSNYEFMRRIDADLLKICIGDLKKAEFKDEMVEKFTRLKNGIGELYVQNYPPNSFSAYTLESLLETYKSNDIKIDIVFLDYLGLMKSDLVSPNVGLYSHIKSIGEEVRAVAKLWDIQIFSCSQMNRAAVNKDSKDIDNSTIADSLGTAMTADFMCMMAQTERQKEMKQITFKITKNRYTGITKEFVAEADYAHMRFLEIGKPEETLIETSSPITTQGLLEFDSAPENDAAPEAPKSDITPEANKIIDEYYTDQNPQKPNPESTNTKMFDDLLKDLQNR